MNLLLQRLVVLPFYKQQAALLAVMALLTFGVVEGNQLLFYHFTLLKSMATSWTSFLFGFILWSIWFLLCFSFLKSTFLKPKYRFLNSIQAKTFLNQYFHWQWVYLQIQAPVSVYFLISVGLSFYFKSWPIAFAGLSFFVFWNIVSLKILIPLSGIEIDSSSKLTKYSFKALSLFQFYNGFKIGFLLKEKLGQFFFVKVCSLFFLNICYYTFKPGSDDVRWFYLALLCSMLSHCWLILELYRFEKSRMEFYKNLPITFFQKRVRKAVLPLLILIPEILFFTFNFYNALSIPSLVSLVFFATGFWMFFETIIKSDSIEEGDLLKICLGIGLAIFLVIAFKLQIPLILLFWLIALFFVE